MKVHGNSHERVSRHEVVSGSSNQAFGLVFAGFFSIVGLWPLIGGAGPRLWCLGIAAAFAAVAFIRPGLLSPLNKLWTKFGLILHRVVNPIVMGFVFYVTITPMGLAMRLFGKDLLNLKFDPNRKSYWIERQPPGPAPDSMTNQF